MRKAQQGAGEHCSDVLSISCHQEQIQQLRFCLDGLPSAATSLPLGHIPDNAPPEPAITMPRNNQLTGTPLEQQLDSLQV